MRHQEFSIGNGMIVATTALDRRPFAITLQEVKGWDTPPEFERLTKKKLWSDGEIYSRTTSFGPKVFTATMFAQFPESASIRGLRTNANALAARINDPFNCEMVYYQYNVEIFRERLACLPDSPFIEDWNPLSNGVEIKLNFYCPDPWKTVFQNGSSTAEAQKRL